MFTSRHKQKFGFYPCDQGLCELPDVEEACEKATAERSGWAACLGRLQFPTESRCG
ncbi:hypothetical protein SBV1_3340003 [Verrucomicrobia bacterium]|nr:hypothetical protein SBV1_3340003 [Verrucomicrobiota bacterium]